jgi:hypothetical protein
VTVTDRRVMAIQTAALSVQNVRLPKSKLGS